MPIELTISAEARKKVYEYLDREEKTPGNRFFNVFLIILITSNVLAVILESHRPFGEQYATELYLFEIFSVLIFTIEYAARIWTSIEKDKYRGQPALKARLKYLFTPLALIDLLAIAPFYLALFFAIDLRFLRLMRMLRLLKLSHHLKGLDFFISVLAKEIVTIASIILTVVILIVLSASLMYTLEREAQPEVFYSIPHSIWWAIVTMTTVGYGDVIPITLGGRILAGVIMLLGMSIVAVPAGILAARFSEELQNRKDRVRMQIVNFLQDGIVNDGERHKLENFARELGLSGEELGHLIEIQKVQRQVVTECPHCGESIDPEKADDIT